MRALAPRFHRATPVVLNFALLSLLLCGAVPLDASVITAAVGGNVADADESGFGDNHNALPGAVPGLIAAGVNASSGGPGSNGTLRVHIEWPLAGLPSAVPGATVRLSTEPGGFTLDTVFFAATGDGNGTLEDSDFETTGTQIAGVLLPTSGSSGPFTFDVTAEVNAALASGFDYFVLQGRVDESLAAGSTFDRGQQIRSTATSNTPDELPQLITADQSVLEVPALRPAGVALLAFALLAGGAWTLRRARARAGSR